MPPTSAIPASLSRAITDLLDTIVMRPKVPVVHVAIDASGTPPELVAYGTVAAPSPQWYAFHNKWDEMLEAAGLDYIRMAEAMCFDGEFQKKSRDWGASREVEREKLLLSAIKLIKEHLNTGAVTIDFVGIRERAIRAKKATNFGALIQQLLNFTPPFSTMALMCDDEQDVAMEYYYFLNRFKRQNQSIAFRLGGICFINDKNLYQLQAADIVAWVYREAMLGNETPFYTALYGNAKPVESKIKIIIAADPDNARVRPGDGA
jgi:hypothetical protein